MNEQERVDLIKEFLNREDLAGTDLKLKRRCLELDQEISVSKQELSQLQQALNEKQVAILTATQKLEGLCDLIVDAQSSSSEEEAPEEETPKKTTRRKQNGK